MRIFLELDITHKSNVLILLTRVNLILLTRFTASPPQSYEDICRTWYYSQVYCLDITHKTQLDITHKLYNITTSIIRIFVGLDITHKFIVLILLTRLSLILLTSFTTSPPQSYEDICRTWYYSHVYCLDITHKTQLDITHKIYNITTSIIWGYL